MDWDVAIRRNHGALLRLLGMLYAMIGPVPTLRREVYFGILRMLRPVESAARRLIVLAARGIVMRKPASRTGSLPDFAGLPRRSEGRAPAFVLIDPRKRFGDRAAMPVVAPRISVPGLCDDAFAPAARTDAVDTARVFRRLSALTAVLDDLPRQARRLARMRAGPKRRLPPLRPGWPPGHRRRGWHPADLVLGDCHALALHALASPDTS